MRQAFAGFERDIADKTVTHHEIGCALENVITLDISEEIVFQNEVPLKPPYSSVFANF